jgi:EIX receptor 1/2
LSGCAKDSLEVLYLPANQITGSLPNFTIFPSLTEIHLDINNINGTVPKSIGNLYKLEVLDLSSNFLQDVISEAHFTNLSKLRSLYLNNNSLALEVKFNWVPPFQLDVINLRSCKLGPRFPNWIQTQRNVSYLDISHANISDSIPAEWLTNLPPTLLFLDLSSNQINGSLPSVSMSMNGFNAFGIDLSANHLDGPLPLFPANLTVLNLSKNRFSGSISSVCKINGGLLSYLDLSDNILSGKLPNCFMHWRNLVILNLAGNKFFGEVPSSLGSLSLLETLKLSSNNFSGDVPSSLKNCSSLKLIDLGGNRFFGKVPAWIGEGLPHLIVLILHSNKFHGKIPLQLCQLVNLQILDLSLNDISGTIPQCFNNFTAMAHKEDPFSEIIDSYYELSHSRNVYYYKNYIDSAMVVLKRREYEYVKNLGLLKIINLSSNKFTGNLPSEILSLMELIGLNVSRNNLTGEIPQMIGHLNKLETLDLSNNQFSGEIPSSMSELNFLSVLDLSYNHLSGKIPSGTQLQSFNASDFAGNPDLCGPPLSPKCPSEQTANRSEDSEIYGDEFWKWFYAGTGLGFAICFWGVCGSLLLKRSWRHAYFLLLDNMKDWLYVTMGVNMARLRRKFQRH